jgi:hypothetical protein
MAWTYSGDPSLSDLDMTRWHVGDTDNTDQLVQDEEIQAALDRYGSPERAAAKICYGISAKFARLFDKAAGDVRKSHSQKSENYRKLGDELMSASLAASGTARKNDQLSNTFVW